MEALIELTEEQLEAVAGGVSINIPPNTASGDTAAVSGSLNINTTPLSTSGGGFFSSSSGASFGFGFASFTSS